MEKQSAVLPVENYNQTYYRQWFVVLLLLAAAGSFYWYQTHTHTAPVAPASTTQTGTAYYVLHMPEMQVHSDVSASRKQFSKWLDALTEEGFTFARLSDVVRDLRQGKTIPEKTVVLLFDPSYRRTVDTYSPVLSKMKIPTVWLTNGEAIGKNDKRFISSHLADVMQASGLWDMGFLASDGEVTLKTGDHQTVLIAGRSPWKTDAGRAALNRGIPESMDRLNVNAKWTEQDLVHRLLVERPIQNSTLLSLQQIQGRNWGIGLDLSTTKESRFTLRAPIDKRSGSLYWLGTTGLNDIHLRMEVKALVGEMRVLLRSDPAAGEGVSVVFAKGKVGVDQDRNGVTHHLAGSACPDIVPNTPFTVVLAVMGRQLALAVNGHPLIALDSLAEPTSSKGMVRLVVQDSLVGVGEAQSVRIVATPLGKTK